MHVGGSAEAAPPDAAAADIWAECWEFWRQELRGCPATVELSARRRVTESRGESLVFEFDQELTASAIAWAARGGVDAGIVLLAAFEVLVSRYSGAEDFVLAVSWPELPSKTGVSAALGAEFIPIRARTDGGCSFAEQVARTGRTVERSVAPGRMPYQVIAERLGWTRDPVVAFSPQLLFGVAAPDRAGDASWGGSTASAAAGDFRDRAPGVDLGLVLMRDPRGMRGIVVFAAELFEREFIRNFSKNYTCLLRELIAASSARMSQIETLAADERDRILAMNDTRTTYPRDSALDELFAEQVARWPDSPAVTYDGLTLTYRQLDRATNSLARCLRDFGVGPGALVAIYADRDVSVVAGMLAIIKAGGAYLPLDPAHPTARLRKIAAEAKPSVLLTQVEQDDSLGLGIPVVSAADHLCSAVCGNAAYDVRMTGNARAQDLAYVMYTSGSSGTPKGICVTHRNVVRLVRDTNYVSFAAGDRVAQNSNAAFDAATFEIWGALLNGGELVGFGVDVMLSPNKLTAAVRAAGIRTMVMATPLFNQLAADEPSIFAPISQLLVGGDVMAVSQARAVAELPGCTLINGYGPTECTTFATTHAIKSAPEDQARIPIGRPIANSTCYVLDEMLRLQPAGVPGQLYIGGDGVARGYLNRADLTADRFLPDPYAAESGARMYATGDVVRLLPEGSLEFLGRADLQTKVRGFRIELTEVDAALLEHGSISEAVTILIGDQAEDKSLVSYYATIGREPVGAQEIVAFLRKRLPDYMIPVRLIRLAEIPKNPNMKIDRSKLPLMSPTPSAGGHVSGSRPLEDVIAAMIAQLLAVLRFDPSENFFDSGGHSLLAAKLLTQLRNRFAVQMTLGDLFENPTARGIAEHILLQAKETMEDSAAVLSPSVAESASVVAGSRAPEAPS